MMFWSALSKFTASEVTVKVSLVMLMALAVVWCLRRRSAAARHWVLSVAVACALALPILSALAPSWYVPATQLWSLTTPSSPRPSGQVDTVVRRGGLRSPGSPSRGDLRVAPAGQDGQRSTAGLMFLIWSVGGVGIGGMLLLGLARLGWLSTRATPVSEPRWLDQADQTRLRLGIRRPVRLLQSDHPTLLATWGLLRPKVMVPSGAHAWSDRRIRVVLAHELAHIRRGDWAVQLGAELLRALFWFNPLMWVATRCLRRDSELACDDTVLGLGVDGSDYATQLLDLAKALRPAPAVLSTGMAMARPSGLERRITAMMNPTLSRQPFLRRSRLAVIVAALAVTIPLAVLAQSGSGTVAGTVVDSTGQPWAGASVALSPAGSEKVEVQWRKALEGVEEHGVVVMAPKIEFLKERIKLEEEHAEPVGAQIKFARVMDEGGEVTRIELGSNRWASRTDEAGRFEIEEVPPGEYRLEVRLPGFASVEEMLTVETGQSIQRDIALQIGSLEETYTIAAGDPAPVPTAMSPATLERMRANVGDGPLQPPIKLRHLTPAYPDSLRANGNPGTVILEALVTADGSFRVLNVLTPVDPDLLTPVQPDLARAAVDAARQWQFEPTRLHGVPVDTRMTVTINFTDES